MTHSSHSVRNCKAGGFSRESSVWEGLLRKQSELSQAGASWRAAAECCAGHGVMRPLTEASLGTAHNPACPGQSQWTAPPNRLPRGFRTVSTVLLRHSLQQTCLRRGINFRTASSVRAELVITRASENTFRCTCVHTPVIASNFYNGRGNILL